MLGMFKGKPSAARADGVTPVAPPRRRSCTTRDFIAVLYIVAFSLFIYGLSGLTGPKTAVRGNQIAAVGMAVAVDRDVPHRRAWGTGA